MRKLPEIARGLARYLPPPVQAVVRHATNPAFRAVNARYSFSQEGEDLLVDRLFDGQDTGFYVDVGAHHPTRFSNTALLYHKGWTGINIDATPGSMLLFDRLRARDTNLELAISNIPGPTTLNLFNESALNTLSDSRRQNLSSTTSYLSIGDVEVSTATLESVLSEHLPDGVSIDFMTVDVEGHDFDVLQSNDWERFRPRVLLIEVLDTPLETLDQRSEVEFLGDRGYRLEAKLYNSVLLLDAQN